jgi:hypothetical protein
VGSPAGERGPCQMRDKQRQSRLQSFSKPATVSMSLVAQCAVRAAAAAWSRLSAQATKRVQKDLCLGIGSEGRNANGDAVGYSLAIPEEMHRKRNRRDQKLVLVGADHQDNKGKDAAKNPGEPEKCDEIDVEAVPERRGAEDLGVPPPITLNAKSVKHPVKTTSAAATDQAIVIQSIPLNGATIKKETARMTEILFGIFIEMKSQNAAMATQSGKMTKIAASTIASLLNLQGRLRQRH